MTCVHEPTQHSDWPLLTSVIDRQQIFVFLKICINRNCSSVECLSYVPLHRFGMNSNSRGRQKSYISNIVPVRLSERVWCTKIFSLLLKSYFHLSGFQYSFILIHFRDGPKRCSHCKIDTLKSCFHIIAMIAELFFLSDRSDNSDRSDHMETRLKLSAMDNDTGMK